MGLRDAGTKKVTLIEQKIQEEEVDEDPIDFDNIEVDINAEDKITFFIYGAKNDGKTVCGYSLMDKGDTALVISIDNQSHHALREVPYLREKIESGDIAVTVVNGTRYYDKSSQAIMLRTAQKTLDYILGVLNEYKTGNKTINGKRPDWVIIDGTERLNGICEMVMRKNNGVRAYDGISNFNLWKERNQYIDDIHTKSFNLCTKGVIYTSYTTIKEIINNSTVVKSKELPKWVGQIMEETNVQIFVEADREGIKPIYYAKISGSKRQSLYPDGLYDITNRTLKESINES